MIWMAWWRCSPPILSTPSPLPASGAEENWFVYDGKKATVDYQRKTLDAFSQLRMHDVQTTVSEDGGTAFVEWRLPVQGRRRLGPSAGATDHAIHQRMRHLAGPDEADDLAAVLLADGHGTLLRMKVERSGAPAARFRRILGRFLLA